MKKIIVIYLLFVGILVIVAIIRSNKKGKKEDNKNYQKPKKAENRINYSNYYKFKRYITTKKELEFYNVLQEIAKELNLTVFSQVVLYNIIEPKNNLDYKTKIKYFNKISSKSIDFVLARKNDCKILLCIELDDSTHKMIERQKRDIFINKLFKDLGIGLLRYPIYKEYYKETLKKRIQENIKEVV